jgi:hypothetical protein
LFFVACNIGHECFFSHRPEAEESSLPLEIANSNEQQMKDGRIKLAEMRNWIVTWGSEMSARLCCHE